MEIDGLTNNASTTVSVSTVDAFGQRSAASHDRAAGGARGHRHLLVPRRLPRSGRARPAGSGGSAPRTPAGQRGSRQRRSRPTAGHRHLPGRAGRPCGPGPPSDCDPARGSGELGRFTIDTDAPGEERRTGPRPGARARRPARRVRARLARHPKPDTAQDDPELPPGTIRVQIGPPPSGPANASRCRSRRARHADGSPSPRRTCIPFPDLPGCPRAGSRAPHRRRPGTPQRRRGRRRATWCRRGRARPR